MAKEYRVGEEATIKGIVTGIGDNAGSPEYTIAVPSEKADRPLNLPPAVAPQAFASHSEVLELNAERDEEARKESEEAEKALAEKDDDEVTGADSPEEIREKTATPDPAKTPAGNASAAPKSATASKTSK